MNTGDTQAASLIKLDVGCGKKKRPGWVGMDCVELPEVDIFHDLTAFPWPVDSDSAEQVVLDNVIEHLPDTVCTMNELHRITAPGGVVEMIYPYYKSKGAYGDPTHVRFFSEYMIEYFLTPNSSSRYENAYAFYTNRYWKLLSRSLVTYPFLRWLPERVLRFGSRHTGLDIVHAVRLSITPDK